MVNDLFDYLGKPATSFYVEGGLSFSFSFLLAAEHEDSRTVIHPEPFEMRCHVKLLPSYLAADL